MKRIKLLTIYAKDYLFFSGIITLLSCFIFMNTGVRSITALFWFKIITSVLGLIVHEKRKAKEVFFYMNNGVGKPELLIYSFATDLIAWFIGITILVNLRG